MGANEPVWDLGEIDRAAAETRSKTRATTPAPRGTVPRAPVPAAAGPQVDWVAALAVPGPGIAQILQGRTQAGLLIVSSFGLAAALVWAIHGTLDRLAGTLEALGLPSYAAVWALAGAATVAVVVHLVAVSTSRPAGSSAPHPGVAAVASAILPGWGQVANGDIGRATVFLAAAWTAAVAWGLSSPAVTDLLVARNLVLPAPLEALTALPFRTALTACTWLLAVQDAAQRAAWIREKS